MYFISSGKVSAMKDSIFCKLSLSILEVTDSVSSPAATKQLQDILAVCTSLTQGFFHILIISLHIHVHQQLKDDSEKCSSLLY